MTYSKAEMHQIPINYSAPSNHRRLHLSGSTSKGRKERKGVQARDGKEEGRVAEGREGTGKRTSMLD